MLDGPGGAAAPLWPFTHVLWAAAEVLAIGGDPPIAELIRRLERFQRGGGFAATPRGRRYFDDNAWLGLASLRLRDVTGDEEHAVRASALAAFVRTGEHPNGGVRWAERSESRNTCSTASAAWLAMEVDRRRVAVRGRAGVRRPVHGVAGRRAPAPRRPLRRPPRGGPRRPRRLELQPGGRDRRLRIGSGATHPGPSLRRSSSIGVIGCGANLPPSPSSSSERSWRIRSRAPTRS